MIEDSERYELLHIDCAARGMVSGTLGEWPFLKNALRKLGILLPDSTDAMELKRICALWWEENVASNDVTATANTSFLTVAVSRVMAAAYQRGVLDASGIDDGEAKEKAIEAYVKAHSQNWLSSAGHLLSMNGIDG